MRKTIFLICLIFLNIACMKKLLAQNSIPQEAYHDPRIIGTWRSYFSSEDYWGQNTTIPSELKYLYATIEITFKPDSSYRMSVKTAAVEETVVYTIFEEKNRKTYKIKNDTPLVVEGTYYFDGEKLYIQNSYSRSVYLKRFNLPDLQELLVDNASINIEWDLMSFSLDFRNPFPAIKEKLIRKNKEDIDDIYFFRHFKKSANEK